MQFDSFTILAAGCALLTLLGSAFVVLWTRDRRAPWLLWWGLPLVFGGSALAFYMRPGWDVNLLSISLGNAMRMLALGCLWQGVRVFQRRKPLLWPLAAICVGWMALCLVPDFVGTLTLRIFVVSLCNAVLCGLTAYELWRDRVEALPSRLPTMLVFISFSLLMLGRAFVAQIAPFPVGALAIDGNWLAGFMFVVFGHTTFAAILFFSMTKERREAEQRSFAMSDPLTGLMNRRAFIDFNDRVGRRRARQNNSIALLVLDLDDFKQVNDRFGHETGDRMLKAFADVAEMSVRPTDQLFRMGGEEFCFVLPDTVIADALSIAERIRRGFEAVTIVSGDATASATVSIGIAATSHAVGLDVMLAAADAAVYEAKARGRNRVVVAEPSALLQTLDAGRPQEARLRA